jgi:hypothetical protein
MRGHSSAGRAPDLHSGGRRFDPVWLHQLQSKTTVGGVEVLVREKKRFSNVIAAWLEAGAVILVLFDMVKRHSSGCDRAAGPALQIPGRICCGTELGAILAMSRNEGAHVAYVFVLKRM